MQSLFLFFNICHQICPNGFVALGRPYCEENPISYADGHALLAPFWIAQDTSPDQDSTAKIWYRTTRDPSVLDDTANHLSGYFDGCKPADFRPRELIIVTWSNVRQIDTCLARGINPDRCHCLYDQPEYLDPRRMSRYCDCIKRQEPEEYCRCEALVKDTTLCRRTPKGKMDHSNTKRDVGGVSYLCTCICMSECVLYLYACLYTCMYVVICESTLPFSVCLQVKL